MPSQKFPVICPNRCPPPEVTLPCISMIKQIQTQSKKSTFPTDRYMYLLDFTKIPTVSKIPVP